MILTEIASNSHITVFKGLFENKPFMCNVLWEKGKVIINRSWNAGIPLELNLGDYTNYDGKNFSEWLDMKMSKLDKETF